MITNLIPCIDDLLNRLASACYFTKINFADACHQVQIKDDHELKTVITSLFGLFEYVLMPFSLYNAAVTFQWLMHEVFRDSLDKFAMVYLDNILILSEDLESHIKCVHWAFERWHDSKPFAKCNNSEFALDKVE